MFQNTENKMSIIFIGNEFASVMSSVQLMNHCLLGPKKLQANKRCALLFHLIFPLLDTVTELRHGTLQVLQELRRALLYLMCGIAIPTNTAFHSQRSSVPYLETCKFPGLDNHLCSSKILLKSTEQICLWHNRSPLCQWVFHPGRSRYKNSFRSSKRSVPGLHARTIIKIRNSRYKIQGLP